MLDCFIPQQIGHSRQGITNNNNIIIRSVRHMGGEKKKKNSEQEGKKLKKQQKKRRKQLQQQRQRQRIQKQKQAEADAMVSPIYTSGLADAYKCIGVLILDFLQQLYKQGVRFNVYEYAAQKILKYEKIQKQKAKKIEQLNIN